MKVTIRATVRERLGRALGVRRRGVAAGDRGFALIVALFALMLLTFLGLTLAATTSTELQIASNYRWAQQAAYNAEAGLEVAKITLRDVTPTWGTVLPVTRAGQWTVPLPAVTPVLPPGAPLVDGGGNPLRHFENAGCDDRGGHTGYGAILNDPVRGPLQYTTDLFGQQLNGAFTVWIRRATLNNAGTGQIGDDPSNSTLVLTSEGIAPFVSALTTFAQTNMAVMVREVTLLRGFESCENYASQAGAGITGAGFFACNQLRGGGGIEDAMGNAARGFAGAPSGGFGSGAAGSLADLGAR